MPTVTAAVARGPHTPLSIEQLTLEAPRPDEVLVRIAATGVCHTDVIARDQWFPVPAPVVLGHEGSPIMGHEFHHSEILMDDEAKYAIRLNRGFGIAGGRDGFVDGNLLASYTHLHSASYRGFPSNFIKACKIR